MSRNFYNFYYDPYRQGYDSTIWRTLWGAPEVVNNQLVLNTATAIHFADILRGEYTFNVNIPAAPSAGHSRSFGLYHPGRGAYIFFDVSGTTFSIKTSDGTISTSTTITWQSDWTATNIKYVIRWEPGTAKFFINGSRVATITDNSVPNSPLSLYASNNTWDSLLLNYIDCTGLQSYTMTPGPEDPATTNSFQVIGLTGEKSESITVTENVSMFITAWRPEVFDTVTVTESVTMLITTLVPSINDIVTVSESVTAFVTIHFLSTNDSVTVTENYAMQLIA